MSDQGIRGNKNNNNNMMQDEPSQEGETATVSCGTSKGPFVALLHRDWSPHGYDRASALFHKGFFDDSHFFRAVPNFLVQFGISYSQDKALQKFASTPIPDDPQLDPPIKFRKGIMSFAGSGPNSRDSQMFIAYGAITGLGDELWETPFGEVIEGMEHVEQFYSYGDMPPWGKGPVQGKIHNNPDYIKNEFPLIDKFETCTVVFNKPGAEARNLGGVDEGGDDGGGGGGEEEEKEEDPGTTTKEEGTDEEEKEGGDDEEKEDEEEENEEEEVGRAELHNRREIREFKEAQDNADDPVEIEQRELEASVKNSTRFGDTLQMAAVVAGIVLMALGLVAISRRARTKKHKL